MRNLIVASLLALTSNTMPVLGHEYWIDPERFAVPTGEAIRADLRVGQAFEGAALIYNPASFRRFEIASPEGLAPVEGRLGDRPAMAETAPEGLAVVALATADSKLTYKAFADFESFVTHKAADWTIDEHRARGLPENGFVEAYSRYAKSLVAVGAARGSDRALGLETEFVALLNPYADDLSGGLPVELHYRGAPRGGAQVEIFEKAPDGMVEVTTVTTDAGGRATIPVRPGYRYMIDAVVLRAPSPALAEATGAVWESLWANLTFAVPD